MTELGNCSRTVEGGSVEGWVGGGGGSWLFSAIKAQQTRGS